MSTPPTVLPSNPAAVRIDRAARWILAGLAVVLLGMFARVVQLQAAPPAPLLAHTGERVSVESEPARRGEILDRRGRIIASTRFGQRVFVDPAGFPSPPDAAILTLADAMGIEPALIGPRIVDKMVENERRRAESGRPAVAVSMKVSKPSFAEAMGEIRERLNADAEPARADAGLVRYISLGGILTDAQADAVRRLNLPGVNLEARSVREVAAEDFVASLLGKVGIDNTGLMGAEMVLEKALKPKGGKLEYVRDHKGRPLYIEPGGYTPPQRGEDVRLSVDLELQRICVEELDRGVLDADAAGGRLVMADPRTGEILAMVDLVRDRRDLIEYDWVRIIPKDNQVSGPRYRTIRRDEKSERSPLLARNRCVEDVYEPGSTFKPFMWAAVTERRLARPEEIFDTEGGRWTTSYGRAISDVVRKDSQDWSHVLINSSNIGMAKGTQRLSPTEMRDAVLKFGFGTRPGTGLPGESPGIVTTSKNWSVYTHTSVAMGHEIAVTPIQMVRAFASIARTGDLAGTLPIVKLQASAGEGQEVVTKRVLPAKTAELTRFTLRGVTHNLDQKLANPPPGVPPEKGWKYELFGKSGTAEIPLGPPPKGKKRPKGSDGYFNGQYNSSFIAAGPFADPQLVVIVVIDDPGPSKVRAREHYGARVAGPVVRRVMERALEYLGAPPSPPHEGAPIVPQGE
ncbi:MAG: peptidoglycan D,D-transpeptidase FtsI family protein [Phycisphaerales bacterium]